MSNRSCFRAYTRGLRRLAWNWQPKQSRPRGRHVLLAACGGSGSEDPRTQWAASSMRVSAARAQR
ncbi:MAG: hypothetical protein OXG81_14105 [Acidobacteria bacterium]|nr:hypothetical protein [Acidobacteriota bacterium]